MMINSINSYYYPMHKPSFCGASSRKFIEKVIKTESYKDLNATFQDLVGAYNELGFEVINKRGSHAIVKINDSINLPLVIPHGKKCVHPNDLKKLKLVIDGEYNKAKLV